MGNEPLSSVFPLIFNCATNQDTKIVDEGLWTNGVQVWKINLVKDYLDAAEYAQLTEVYKYLIQVSPLWTLKIISFGGLAVEDFLSKMCIR